MWERLYFVRSSLPAVTHVDYSARVQTVSAKTNPRYWKLLQSFKRRQGCPVLVNTSFNVRGELVPPYGYARPDALHPDEPAAPWRGMRNLTVSPPPLGGGIMWLLKLGKNIVLIMLITVCCILAMDGLLTAFGLVPELPGAVGVYRARHPVYHHGLKPNYTGYDYWGRNATSSARMKTPSEFPAGRTSARAGILTLPL